MYIMNILTEMLLKEDTHRRAVSADHASTRAQERARRRIVDAIAVGAVAKPQENMNVTLKLLSDGNNRLVGAGGVIAPECLHEPQVRARAQCHSTMWLRWTRLPAQQSRSSLSPVPARTSHRCVHTAA